MSYKSSPFFECTLEDRGPRSVHKYKKVTRTFFVLYEKYAIRLPSSKIHWFTQKRFLFCCVSVESFFFHGETRLADILCVSRVLEYFCISFFVSGVSEIWNMFWFIFNVLVGIRCRFIFRLSSPLCIVKVTSMMRF